MNETHQTFRGKISNPPDSVSLGVWGNDPSIGSMIPLSTQPLTNETVQKCLQVLSNKFMQVRTGALLPFEQIPFLDEGFVRSKSLLIFIHEFSPTHPRIRWITPKTKTFLSTTQIKTYPLTKGWKQNYRVSQEIDKKAFSPFWQLTYEGFQDACGATQRSRFTVAWSSKKSEAIGYCIVGQTLHRGYIQRIAVHPQWQRQGVAKLLLADALAWVYRHRGKTITVNTQEDNVMAQLLYTQMGFAQQSYKMAILEKRLAPTPMLA